MKYSLPLHCYLSDLSEISMFCSLVDKHFYRPARKYGERVMSLEARMHSLFNPHTKKVKQEPVNSKAVVFTVR